MEARAVPAMRLGARNIMTGQPISPADAARLRKIPRLAGDAEGNRVAPRARPGPLFGEV